MPADPELERARKAANARAYRARHPEKHRESRRRCDAKRRQSPEWKAKQKTTRDHREEYARRLKRLAPAPAPAPKVAKPAPKIDPVTGWAAWATSP